MSNFDMVLKSVMLRLHRATFSLRSHYVLTTFSLRPYYVLKKNKDIVRTWYGLEGRGRNVVRT